MKIFVKFLIILITSAIGLCKTIDHKQNAFYARKLLSIDWCSLNCGTDKINIACELNGKCDTAQEPCKFESIDKNKLLDAHNKLRSKFATGEESQAGGLKVSNMMALDWDEDLAFTAKCNLAKCGGMAHDKCRTTPKFPKYAGQNLWSYGSTASGQDCIGQALQGVQQWYDEVKKVNADQIKKDGKAYTFNTETGHFTQVVWAEVTHIGCALTKNGDGGQTQCMMACNYGPGGNMMGASMFKEGKPCSECPNGIGCSSTYKGLCGDDGGGAADLHPNIGLIIICLLLLHRFLTFMK